MSVVRGIWVDLVDKRLWPIALVLVVAAVAIPVLLHKQPEKVTAAPIARDVAGARLPVGSDISLNSEHAQGMLAGLRLHDPFHQLHLPKAVASSTSAVGPATASGSPTAAPSGPGSSSGGGGGSSGGGSAKPKTSGTTKLRLRFGAAGTAPKTYELAPLTALPTASNPILIYLGLLKDGKTAAFLVSSDGTPQGDGTCKPSATICQTLLMKPGDTEFLDLDGATGAVQYELDVLKVVHG